MIAGKKIIVIMPAYRAEKTLAKTVAGLPPGVADGIILTDDASGDRTIEIAERLGLMVLRHDRNRGYGANQKTCYRAALDAGADVVVMLHPDYQYPPERVADLAAPVAEGRADIVLGSRFLDGEVRRCGMPLYKFIGNRLLTAWQNLCLGLDLSEYHTGFRAFGRRVLEQLPFAGYADDFIFDNQILTDAAVAGFRIAEIGVRARYESESSSIGLGRSVKYGLQVLGVSAVGRRRLRSLRSGRSGT